jgi:pimeloyl-ACP methyl ester carboxylesterase
MPTELKSDRFAKCVYTKSGQGFPIILLHGFAEDHHIWKYQVAALKTNYTVIVPDLPGSGLSPLPKEEMSIELFADFVFDIIQQEQLEKIILIGHSMGGYATLAFAEKYEPHLAAFSLVHSSAYEDDDAKKINRQKTIKLIQHNGKEVFLNAMIPNLYSELSKKTLQSEMNEHLTNALKISADSLQAYYTAMIHRPSKISILENTSLPVQFIIGTDDNAVPFSQSLQQAAIAKIAKVDILRHVGHSGMVESPTLLNTMLNSFLKYALKL